MDLFVRKFGAVPQEIIIQVLPPKGKRFFEAGQILGEKRSSRPGKGS